MNSILPLLAADAALQLATIFALSGTAVAPYINGLVEVAIDAFDGSVVLSDLFTGRNVFEFHPEDLRFLVERITSVDGNIKALAVERIGNNIAVLAQSLCEASFTLRWETDKGELLTAPDGGRS
jgi:hypothetical protein